MPQLTQTHRPQLLHRFPFISLSIVMKALFFKQKTHDYSSISVTCAFFFFILPFLYCVTAVHSADITCRFAGLSASGFSTFSRPPRVF